MWWDELSLQTGGISAAGLGRTCGPSMELDRQEQSSCPPAAWSGATSLG